MTDKPNLPPQEGDSSEAEFQAFKDQLRQGGEGAQTPEQVTSEKKSFFLSLKFWLGCAGICLLVVVALVFFAVSYSRNSMRSVKQRRNAADVRAIATALLTYQLDQGKLPSFSTPLVNSTFQKELGIEYLSYLPPDDIWGNRYEVWIWTDNKGIEHFQVFCLGMNGQPDYPSFPAAVPKGNGLIKTNCLENDIIWQDDDFLVWPEGKQKKCS